MNQSDPSAPLPHVYVCTDSNGGHPKATAAMLAQAGYRAKVVMLFTPEDYRHWRTGNILLRLWLRLYSKLLGPLFICLRSLFWPRGSVIIVNTNLLFGPLGLSLLGRLRGHKVIYLLYDLYPDALEVLEGKHGASLFRNVLAWITRRTLRSTDATVYLGDFLRAHTEQRYGAAQLARVIHVAVPDPELVRMAEADRPQRPYPPLRLRYGGQLGHMHCPQLTATAVATVAGRFGQGVHFDFFVCGPGVAQAAPIMEPAGIPLVELAEELNWKESLRTYDFALVALSPGGATVCFPSKTYGMLAAGLPLIAICPHWSDLAGVIRQYGVGFVVNNSPFDAIVDADGVRYGLPEGPALDLRSPEYLEQMLKLRTQEEVNADFEALVARLLEDPSLVEQARAKAIEAAGTAISQEVITASWAEVVAAVSRQGGAAK